MLKILRCAQDGIEGICYSERIEDFFYQIYLNEVNNGNVFFFIKILHGTRKYIGNKYAQLFLHLPATYD